jgi:signal transduction histidine kinase
MTRRLLVTYLLVTLLLLAALELPRALTFARRQREKVVSELARDGAAIGTLSLWSLEHERTTDLDALVTGHHRRTGDHVVIVDADGDVVTASDPTAEGRHLGGEPDLRRALDGETTTASRWVEGTGPGNLYVGVPVASGDVVYGAVGLSRREAVLDGQARRYWATRGAIAAAIVGSAVVVGIALARWLARPVNQLTATAAAFADGRLDRRAPADGGELGRLATTFNDMASRLSELLDSQRAFVADASHQLLTPLTALRLRLENLEPALDEESRPELDATLLEAERLSRMVDGLLDLARAEGATVTCEPVEVSGAVQHHVGDWTAAAHAREIHLEVQSPVTCVAEVVPGALEQILDNLLSNALRVAPGGSTVTVRVAPVKSLVELHIIDEGPGMDEEQRRRAFDRFWRGPSAKDERGSGLGLAIVRQLAVACGGAAKLLPGPGKGTDAVVYFRLGGLSG